MIDKKEILKNEYYANMYYFGTLRRVPCTKQENMQYQAILKSGGMLPKGVFQHPNKNSEFFVLCGDDFTESERIEFIMYKQLRTLYTIKNCLVFFTVMAIIGMVLGLIAAIS